MRPEVRRLVVRTAAFPAAATPMRIILFSDLHVHGPDMPPSRVAAIVGQINALKPDLIIAAGDFLGDSWIGRQYPASEAIAPLGGLKAKYGIYAVLGNNDYDSAPAQIEAALKHAGVQVLRNQALRIGPITLGGIDGDIRVHKPVWKQRREQTYAEFDRLPGPKVLIAHRPDEFKFAPSSIDLVLAGHTHCGQVVLPFIGPLVSGSDFGDAYLCGVIRDGPKTLVVTAGVGTSHLPLRIGAPPDIWLITLRT